MTEQEFEQKTGRKPRDDDLERVNCSHVGEFGHWQCGWCLRCDRPRFECGHVISLLKQRVIEPH
jgi:hypothetical protein